MRKTILLPVLALLLTGNIMAQSETNGNELVMECTRIVGEGQHKQMVIWYPLEFWDVLKTQAKLPEYYVEKLKDDMKGYLMFCVADYIHNAVGMKFKPAEEVRKSATLTDSSGKVYYPLSEEEVSPSAAVLMSSMQPVFSRMFGQFGEGMVILMFKAEVKDDQQEMRITNRNRFTLNVDNTPVTFKLPLAAGLPPKQCPIDKEPMKGNWHYCPEHGVKLD